MIPSSLRSFLLLSDIKGQIFLEQADLVITNTCSVREKAEEKAFSFIGRLQALKRKTEN
jgi:tRNA A37 methylthiotransferase MiaB